MELSGLVGVLLLMLVIFLVIKMIIDSIKLVLVVLLAMFVLVYFFGISLSDASAWLSSQQWLRSLVRSAANALLFSLRGS